MSHYIGVDVGTGSARACLMNAEGEIVSLASKNITKWEPVPDYINQSSTEIWESVCFCTKKVIEDSGVDPAQVKGIGFDATCSLVVLDEENKPVAVGPDFHDSHQNILLWMDHRAGKQTKKINRSGFKLLDYVGGRMSVEMEIPKILWLKDNMPEDVFAKCKFYDLPDYLTHQATGQETRSFCSITCKQGFEPVGVDNSTEGWNRDFLTAIGLPELVEDDFAKLGGSFKEHGKNILSAGDAIGPLSEESAKELGLTTATIVGSAVIDAYAGWIGTVAAKTDILKESHPSYTESIELATHRLAAVAGTSTCHLIMSKEPIFVPGVWGPYRDVLEKGYWLAEGGQSATGELLHHILTSHPAHLELVAKAGEAGISTFDWLNNRLEEMKLERNAGSLLYLTRNMFFYGDLHGNRSPIADSSMKGAFIGLDFDVSLDNLALHYLCAVEFIAQQTRQIVEALNNAGHQVNQIYLSGGQCRNHVLTQIMSSATGYPLIIPKYIDAAVVLGSAMLGARAAHKKDLWEIMGELSGPGKAIYPETDTLDKKILDAKYAIFLDQAETQQKYRAQVAKALGEDDDHEDADKKKQKTK
ncbi:putative sugar kinase [Yarrowia sp. B02]|nr:putative sugar kinase [Yarrowia sp. B02]